MHGAVFKNVFRNSAKFKMELYEVIDNSRKLQRASTNVKQG